MRINLQLIDALGGGHLWAERFDRGSEDIFAVQASREARVLLERAISLDPGYAEAYHWLGFVLYAEGYRKAGLPD